MTSSHLSRTGIVYCGHCQYPNKETLFAPHILYPEFEASGRTLLSEADNPVYDMVREGFRLMGFDSGRFGTPEWNPLGVLVSPGDTVLLKPNLVMDHNPNGGRVDCLYTHPSIVAAVLDYVLLALRGNGEVIIGDAPMQECDFDKLIAESGYAELIRFYQQADRGVRISLRDFRDLKTTIVNRAYHQDLAEESRGIEVRLDRDSEFWGMEEADFQRLRITNYDPRLMIQHHNPESCAYCISRDVLRADVVINLPKPKTHRKAGVTIALKNMVGINSRKEYLPHHTLGAKEEGGDEYLNRLWAKQVCGRLLDRRNLLASEKKYGRARLATLCVRGFHFTARVFQKDPYREGSWYGNDTISKTIVDLNKILLYADKDGQMRDTRQRKYLVIGDMIVSGEGEGPILPSPKDVGILAFGDNPVSFDLVVACIMGAKLDRIPTLLHAAEPKGRYVLADYSGITVVSNDQRWNGLDCSDPAEDAILFYRPTSGWVPAFKIRNP